MSTMVAHVVNGIVRGEPFALVQEFTIAQSFPPPLAAEMVEIGAATVHDGYLYSNGAFAAPAGPTLGEAQNDQIALLSDACRSSILSGFQSSALGAAHSYPSGVTDQTNLAGSVVASLLPGLATGWTTPFWCADSTGTWSFAAHTAAQIQQVGVDGKAMVVAAQTKLAGLEATVMAAATVAAVEEIAW